MTTPKQQENQKVAPRFAKANKPHPFFTWLWETKTGELQQQLKEWKEKNKKEYDMDYESYSDKELKCKPREQKEKYDGIVVEIGDGEWNGFIMVMLSKLYG